MSSFSQPENYRQPRRGFLRGALTVGAGCLLRCAADAQAANEPFSKALSDPEVIHGPVTFRSGAGTIDGYLARPKAKGRFPAVLVVTGNTVGEEYIRNTTALLAQAGFVGLAPNIFALQLESMDPQEKRDVFANKITDENIFQDLQAGVDYLKPLPFVKRGRMGVVGFCFGGRCALLFAAKSRDIGAAVPFYGNLKTPPFANRKVDPVDVVSQMKVPIQGHYAAQDAEVPLEQLRRFEQELHTQGTPVEMFTYAAAAHGFFAYTRASYNAAAAQLAWERTIQFFRSKLK